MACWRAREEDSVAEGDGRRKRRARQALVRIPEVWGRAARGLWEVLAGERHVFLYVSKRFLWPL